MLHHPPRTAASPNPTLPPPRRITTSPGPAVPTPGLPISVTSSPHHHRPWPCRPARSPHSRSATLVPSSPAPAPGPSSAPSPVAVPRFRSLATSVSSPQRTTTGPAPVPGVRRPSALFFSRHRQFGPCTVLAGLAGPSCHLAAALLPSSFSVAFSCVALLHRPSPVALLPSPFSRRPSCVALSASHPRRTRSPPCSRTTSPEPSSRWFWRPLRSGGSPSSFALQLRSPASLFGFALRASRPSKPLAPPCLPVSLDVPSL